MTQEIRNFVDGYNMAMDWNKNILNDFVPIYTKDFIKEFLSTDKITEEDYDLDNAKIYSYDDTGILELQVFSNKVYGGVYFWLKPGETEEEYKKRKIEQIEAYINKRVSNLLTTINELASEKDELSKIKEQILNYRV